MLFSEEFIALAILRLVEMEKAVVEGAGAIGLAAVLGNYVPELTGKKYVRAYYQQFHIDAVYQLRVCFGLIGCCLRLDVVYYVWMFTDISLF